MTVDEVLTELMVAQDWASIRDIVEVNSDVLNTSEADNTLRGFAAELRRDDKGEHADSVDHLRALIADSRQRGVGRAFVALVPETPALCGIATTYCLAAGTWEELREVVQRYADVLLAPYMDARLAAAEQASGDDTSAARMTAELRKLLVSCRQYGIDVAFRGRTGKVPFTKPLPREIIEFSVVRRVIRALFDASSFPEWIRIIRAHSDVLLSDAADSYLAEIAANTAAEGQENIRLLVQRLQLFLLRCRLKGVEAAIVEVT